MTIAALFKICVEAFELIQTSGNQDIDYKKLALRLRSGKCRLYTWEKGQINETEDCAILTTSTRWSLFHKRAKSITQNYQKVASAKMDTVSTANTKRHEWLQSEAHDVMDDLDYLTITELKHLLREKITLQPTSTAQGLFSVGSALEQRGARVAQV
jgi:hypothetical protein